jgi:hypothetical protein
VTFCRCGKLSAARDFPSIRISVYIKGPKCKAGGSAAKRANVEVYQCFPHIDAARRLIHTEAPKAKKICPVPFGGALIQLADRCARRTTT